MEPIFIIGFIVLGIYKIFELFVRQKERLLLIEKLPAIVNKDLTEINLPSFGSSNSGSWALKISLLLIGIGLGSLIAFFITIQIGIVLKSWDMPFMNNDKELVRLASIAFFGGLGLFSAYLIESKQAKKKD